MDASGRPPAVDEALERIAAENLWEEVKAKNRTTDRVLKVSPPLARILRSVMWDENRRTATDWFLGVTAVMWLAIPFDYIIAPGALATIVAGHVGVTTVALVLTLRAWRHFGSDAWQGAAACLFIAAVMVVAVVIGQEVGGANFERYVAVGFFSMSTAIALLPVGMRWTALTALILNAAFVLGQCINPAVDPTSGLLFALYAGTISGTEVWMRAQMNSRQFRAALLRVTEARNRRLLKESNDRLHVMAHTDALTGLHNRKAIGEDFARLLRKAPAGEALSVAMIDIDDFKRLNDSLGHEAGDQALRAVGTLLLDVAAAHGAVCGRIGGEEFLVLMPRTTAEAAWSRIQALMEALHRLNIPNPGSRVAERVTLSAGIVTAIPAETDDCHPESMMRGTDLALYDAKMRGRNRIVAGTVSPAAAVRNLTARIEQAHPRPVMERSSVRRA